MLLACVLLPGFDQLSSLLIARAGIEYGVCGVGAYCLGGCDPKHSTTIDSCVPAPICKNTDSTFPNLDRIADKTKYLGDSTKADWVADGEPLIYNNNLLLTMAPGTVGTVLASTVYVWYGKISATLKTSKGKGVVSAFIFLSDMKDEIDYEWVGADLNTAQTNWYFQGIPNCKTSRPPCFVGRVSSQAARS